MKYWLIIFILLIGSSVNAQSSYFYTSKNDIEKVAKNDGYRVSTEMVIEDVVMNIIYYLTKGNVTIRVGYLPEMDLPAFIHYREQ